MNAPTKAELRIQVENLDVANAEMGDAIDALQAEIAELEAKYSDAAEKHWQLAQKYGDLAEKHTESDKFNAPNRVRAALKQIIRGDEPLAKVLAEAAMRDIS